MNAALPALIGAALLAGCATEVEKIPEHTNPPMRPGGPNWEEVDKSVQRIKDREAGRPRLVETVRATEQGFHEMSADDYAAALDAARADLRKANPKISDSDLEQQATKPSGSTSIPSQAAPLRPMS
jgi:outer membrane murein-binding lipoprotein Lpp